MSEYDTVPAGLGIDLCPRAPFVHNVNLVPSISPCSHLVNKPEVREDPRSYDGRTARRNSKLESPPSYTGPNATLRSISAMRGLLLAEVGDSMVEFDIGGGGSGFREGQRIALESVTPGGGSNHHKYCDAAAKETSLSRHGTLLSVDATPGQNAVELKSLLGNSNSRLKPGALILPLHGQTFYGIRDGTSLEQAKPRARVEVDIALESNTCVQGGYLKGHIKVHIRKRSKKESDVMISGGKLRVVGFECIPNEDDRHTFYQCSALLSAITASSESIYASSPDVEGFSRAREGIHKLPFAMFLPLDGEVGNPKGAIHVHSGVTVRYIAMISIKVKDSDTGKRSIAHFYRNCKIWPRLNPSVILAASPRPLQATVSKNLFMGGIGKVTLTASLHRLHWVAGQLCYVKVNVTNDTKKTIKSLTLTLIRSVIVFKPHPHLDALPPSREHAVDPDACQTSTTQKHVAETTLEMGQRSARGHASAKGWWTGVRASDHVDFSHFLPIPPDALSVTRGRLLEVEYTIRVSLSAGSLASDIQVILPIRIINFLSIDPPPSYPLSFRENSIQLDRAQDGAAITETYITGLTNHSQHSRPAISGIFAPSAYYQSTRVLGSVSEDKDEPESSDQDIDYLSHGELSDESSQFDEAHGTLTAEQDIDYNTDPDDLDTEADLGNLSMHDDSDDIVQYAITAARIDNEYGENTTRFADLYYASVQQEDLSQACSRAADRPRNQAPELQDPSSPDAASSPSRDPIAHSSQVQADQCPKSHSSNAGSGGSRPSRPRGPSSFALRVQEKLQVATGTIDSGRLPEGVETNFNQEQNVLKGVSMQDGGDETCDIPASVFDPTGGPNISARAGVGGPALFSLPSGIQPGYLSSASSGSSDSECRPADCRIKYDGGACHLDTRCPSDKSFTGGEARTSALRVESSSSYSSGSSVNPGATKNPRLLPRPPSLLAATNILPAAAIPVNDLGPTPSAVAAAHVLVAHPQESVSVARGCKSGDPANASVIVSRPPLVPATGGSGSVSSVKDKIKELEERFRVEQLGGTG